MKLQIVGAIIILSVFGYEANADNGKMMKACLDTWGYDKTASLEERLAFSHFNEVSACVSNYVVAKHKEKLAADRAFLKKNPWFKGTNWKWQERAEYTCTKHHHTGFTVCQKPYYVN